jgi:hypothetical protein
LMCVCDPGGRLAPGHVQQTPCACQHLPGGCYGLPTWCSCCVLRLARQDQCCDKILRVLGAAAVRT